jgi:hypothetical protein
MQQLAPAAQQLPPCEATSEVAFAVLISAATAIIMKYFIVPPVEDFSKFSARNAEPTAIRQASRAAAARVACPCDQRSPAKRLKHAAERRTVMTTMRSR